MHDGLEIVAVRTPTLPPATHTNTWIVGEGALTVIDPASPFEDEQRRFFDHLDERRATGEEVERILLTHHHHDHVSGVVALVAALADEGVRVPVLAHAATAELVRDRIVVDEHIEDGSILRAGGRTLTALHTPGHAPGHLVFQDEGAGWMIAGDMVAGIGTILLHPDEGDLGHYLASLERMRRCSPTVLLPSHGPDLPEADALLGMYAAHRHMRSEQIRVALATHGSLTALEVAPYVYPELPEQHLGMAALQIATHLRWMGEQGLATAAGEARWTSR